MKKGLLSILAVSTVLVGCQNYDDQFDALNTQITALQSTVAELSGVRSEISDLRNLVNSVQTAVDGVNNELSADLAAVLEDVNAIDEELDSVATAEELAEVTASVEGQRETLDEILANSQVFQGDVIVSTQATLEVFERMGSALNVVNGRVDIDVDTTMDTLMVQSLVDNILVTVEQFEYTAATGVDAEITFSNLTGTQTLTIDQKGGYMLENLGSATAITLDDDNTTDIVHLGSLTSVKTLNSGGSDGDFHFDKASELHLTSLPRYGASLSLKVDTGGVIDITALRDVDADGDQDGLNLTIEGPAAMTVDQLDGAGGSLTFNDVADVDVNSYDGTVTIGADVEYFTTDGVYQLTFTNAADIIEMDVTGKLNPADDDDEEGPAFNISGYADLTDLTLHGTFENIDVDGNNNLVDLTIDATVTGAAGIEVVNNTDLENVTLTGASTEKVIFDDNSDLVDLLVDVTAADSDDDGSDVDLTVTVTNNESLTELAVNVEKLENLTVTDNVDLEEINFTGTDSLGDTGEATATVKDNNLEAQKASDKEDGPAAADDEDDGADGDLGSFEESAGMDTLVPYMEALLDDSDSVAEIVFDLVETSVGEDDSETADVADYVVLELAAAIDEVRDGQNDSVTEWRAWYLDIDGGGSLEVEVDGVTITNNGTTYGAVSLSGNQNVDIAGIVNTLATTRAEALDIEFEVVKGGNNTMKDITFFSAVSSSSNGENYNDAQAAALGSGSNDSFITSYDVFTLRYGAKSITASISTASASGSDASDAIASQLAAAWNAKWGTGGTSANLSIWDTVDGDTTSGTITAPSMKDTAAGVRGYNDVISVSWAKATAAQVSIATAGVVTQTSDLIMDWNIGTDSDSNVATSDDLILRIRALNYADNILASSKVTVDFGSASEELTSTLISYGTSAANTDTTSTVYPTEARLDVRAREDSNEGTITTAAEDAVRFTRVHWFGS